MSDDLLPAKEISKVANNLLNKVAKAIGAAYAPIHVTRMAKAEAKAKIFTARANVEITDIQRRAEARRLHEEERDQENIEAITRVALPHLKDDAKPEKLDEDWVSGFFEYARKVSDQEMQSLWAKILAGEANAPGSFRKRVLQSVALLDKDEAQLFTRLCRFCVDIAGRTPVILDLNSEIYAAEDLTFENLSHLDSVGLISFNNFTGFIREPIPSKMIIRYGSKRYALEMPQGKKEIRTGTVLLTQIGQQLLPLCQAQDVPEFDDYFIEQWKKDGITVTPEFFKRVETTKPRGEEAPQGPIPTGGQQP